MEKFKDKVKKRRINWRNMIFHLHKKELSEAFDLFRFDHPDMSINRCAYYVLKSYYSTTTLVAWRKCYRDFNMSEEELASFNTFARGWMN